MLLDTSELLGSEVLAIEIAGLGSPVYFEAFFQTVAAAVGAFQLQKVAKLDTSPQIKSGATLSLSTLKFAHCVFLSTSTGLTNVLSAKIPICNFTMLGATQKILSGVQVKRAQLDIGIGQSLTNWDIKKISVGEMASQSYVDVHFARPTKIILSEIYSLSQSLFGIQSIGLSKFIDQADAIPRYAEMRNMNRGLPDSNMAVFSLPNMSRLAEGRSMVAP